MKYILHFDIVSLDMKTFYNADKNIYFNDVGERERKGSRDILIILWIPYYKIYLLI